MRPGSNALAALWGFAEATLFFIVPDVLLTSIALTSLKKALWASLSAAFAAACGGLLVWYCSGQFPQETRAVLLGIPGISEATIAAANQLLQGGLFTGMLQGAFSGIPYKVFAFEAGRSDINPLTFSLLSPAGRLPRFLLLTVVAWSLSTLIGDRLSAPTKLAISLALWGTFYLFYFSVVGW